MLSRMSSDLHIVKNGQPMHEPIVLHPLWSASGDNGEMFSRQLLQQWEDTMPISSYDKGLINPLPVKQRAPGSSLDIPNDKSLCPNADSDYWVHERPVQRIEDAVEAPWSPVGLTSFNISSPLSLSPPSSPPSSPALRPSPYLSLHDFMHPPSVDTALPFRTPIPALCPPAEISDKIGDDDGPMDIPNNDDDDASSVWGSEWDAAAESFYGIHEDIHEDMENDLEGWVNALEDENDELDEGEVDDAMPIELTTVDEPLGDIRASSPLLSDQSLEVSQVPSGADTFDVCQVIDLTEEPDASRTPDDAPRYPANADAGKTSLPSDKYKKRVPSTSKRVRKPSNRKASSAKKKKRTVKTPARRNHPCPFADCNAASLELAQLRKHILTHLPKLWHCPGCAKEFRRGDPLKRHLENKNFNDCLKAAGPKHQWQSKMMNFYIGQVDEHGDPMVNVNV